MIASANRGSRRHGLDSALAPSKPSAAADTTAWCLMRGLFTACTHQGWVLSDDSNYKYTGGDFGL